jgi:hypothetical protein
MKISCDSQSAIFVAKNPTYHSKTKHIDVLPFHEIHGGKQQGVAGDNRHIGKHNRLFDQVCECCEVLLLQRGNVHCCPGSVNKSSEISRFQQRKQQVGECWVVIFFIMKF